MRTDTQQNQRKQQKPNQIIEKHSEYFRVAIAIEIAIKSSIRPLKSSQKKNDQNSLTRMAYHRHYQELAYVVHLPRFSKLSDFSTDIISLSVPPNLSFVICLCVPTTINANKSSEIVSRLT